MKAQPVTVLVHDVLATQTARVLPTACGARRTRVWRRRRWWRGGWERR